MRKILTTAFLAASVLCGTCIAPSFAESRQHHHRIAPAADHPLTIGGRHRGGIYRQGNSIIAPGGFGAHGYGYPVANADERREALNASINARSSGLYGYGVDGLGGTGFESSPETGYDNPYYGNAFNSYVGYNGVPSSLAFGPGYANRHLADHDPEEDDEPGPPSPGQLGYSLQPQGEDD